MINVNNLKVGDWGQCYHCGVIYRINHHRKLGVYTVNNQGYTHELQHADPPEHWCGAEWQGPRPHDLPVEWVPGQIPKNIK